MKKMWSQGDFFIGLSGAALAGLIIMVSGLLTVIFYNGISSFWPGQIYSLMLNDGRVMSGEIVEREAFVKDDQPPATAPLFRIKVKRGNRDIYGDDFIWVNESEIKERKIIPETLVIERMEWGDFYGRVQSLKKEDKIIASGGEKGWQEMMKRLPQARDIYQQIRKIQRQDLGESNYQLEKLRLEERKLNLQGIESGKKIERLKEEMAKWKEVYKSQEEEIILLREKPVYSAVIVTVEGNETEIPLSKIVRVYQPNRFDFAARLGFFLEKFAEFISGEPRESNTEGGVFPVIFGTVMMVLLMSLVATPLGVLTAFYLREYSRQGPFVSLVRIAVNNLAGVPSIVFGVFGLGFFIYFLGGNIDQLFFPEVLPTPTFGTGGILWASLTLALLTVPVVIVVTEEGLAAIPRGTREAALALGATKFETLWRVVLPAVMPAILTGLILAMARAAGEVAPLMITGVVKMAPSFPIDGTWPFLHLDRKFMHLGFHIYDMGFQSPNVDAARPLVFASTMLLLIIVFFLNSAAIILRKRIRKKLAIMSL